MNFRDIDIEYNALPMTALLDRSYRTFLDGAMMWTVRRYRTLDGLSFQSGYFTRLESYRSYAALHLEIQWRSGFWKTVAFASCVGCSVRTM